MGLFGGGGKTRDQMIAEAADLNVQQATQQAKPEEGPVGSGKLDLEVAKIKGQLDSFAEVRKASTERFSRVSEQMGELRGMIIDTNKAMSKVEVSASKAVDLVESVHPEKLMIEVRKQDGKIESLRASIESNEAMMKDIMLEMKKMRDTMKFYKGIEQVVTMNEEVKQELATMKRVEATVERHADKVETVFTEVEKKFAEFDKFNETVKDMDKSFKKLQSDFEKVKVKIEMKLERKDFIDLLDKFNDFEKHTTNLLKLLDERNKTAKNDLDAQFKTLEIDYRKKLDTMKPAPATVPTAKTVEPTGGNSGEDGAGGDVKRGFFAKLSGIFHKKEKVEAPAKVEAPPAEEPKPVAPPVAAPTAPPPKVEAPKAEAKAEPPVKSVEPPKAAAKAA